MYFRLMSYFQLLFPCWSRQSLYIFNNLNTFLFYRYYLFPSVGMQLFISTVPLDEEFHPLEEQSHFLCFDLTSFISLYSSTCKKCWNLKPYPHMSMTFISLCHNHPFFSRLRNLVLLCIGTGPYFWSPSCSSIFQFNITLLEIEETVTVGSIHGVDEQSYNKGFLSFSLIF